MKYSAKKASMKPCRIWGTFKLDATPTKGETIDAGTYFTDGKVIIHTDYVRLPVDVQALLDAGVTMMYQNGVAKPDMFTPDYASILADAGHPDHLNIHNTGVLTEGADTLLSLFDGKDCDKPGIFSFNRDMVNWLPDESVLDLRVAPLSDYSPGANRGGPMFVWEYANSRRDGDARFIACIMPVVIREGDKPLELLERVVDNAKNGGAS